MRDSSQPRVGIWSTILVIAAVVVALLPGTAHAAPTSTEFDFSHFGSVNPDPYRSPAYADRGRHYFTADGWWCQIGPQAGAAACRGKPATAPPGVIGVAISGEQQGPYWIRPGTSFQLGSVSGFRAPALPVGEQITVADVTCAVPRAGVVACRNHNRGFMLSRGTHLFLYPPGDTAHDRDPKVVGRP